ncbi:hypothetical protein TWF696_005310 [Orbilia brochopaga]|uniref:Protein kinase domain-containing protein n=1 Tax=Orbilia brochopaga TaxID=3140254 RepID=A0AAV9V358_9PEZI
MESEIVRRSVRAALRHGVEITRTPDALHYLWRHRLGNEGKLIIGPKRARWPSRATDLLLPTRIQTRSHTRTCLCARNRQVQLRASRDLQAEGQGFGGRATKEAIIVRTNAARARFMSNTPKSHSTPKRSAPPNNAKQSQQETITDIRSFRFSSRTGIIGTSPYLSTPNFHTFTMSAIEDTALEAIPALTTDDLQITPQSLLHPLDHGGHSLVFKVAIAPSVQSALNINLPTPVVLKIFRFTLPVNPAARAVQDEITRDRHEAYFLSECTSYTLLQSPLAAVPFTPVLFATVMVSSSLEPHLRGHFSLTPRIDSQRKIPIKGILISYVPGLRLSAFQSIPTEIARKVIDGLRFIHSRGVLHHDVKKRNLMIAPGAIASSRAGATDDDKNDNVNENGEKATRDAVVVPRTDASSGGNVNDNNDNQAARETPLDGSEEVFWIDFSNSLTIENWGGESPAREEAFARAMEAEMREAVKMVTRLQR